MDQENLDHFDVVSNSKKIKIKGLIDLKITQKKSKDAIVNFIIEIHIQDPNYIKLCERVLYQSYPRSEYFL